MIARALLVGINKYCTQDASAADLAGCLNDVGLVADVLQSHFGCSPNRITVLADETATGKNLRLAFSDLVTGVGAGECVFFYFSGHGIRVPDFDGDEVESEFPWDAGGPWDEALVTHDFSKTRPFLDDEIRALRLRIPARAKITMILDCCYSGGMPRASVTFRPGQVDPDPRPRAADELSRDFYSAAERQQLTQHKHSFTTEEVDENFVALAACEEYEKSWEQWIDGKRHGLFTHGLCSCLAERGPSISARELIDFAYRRIREQPGFGQTPRLVGNRRYFDAVLFD